MADALKKAEAQDARKVVLNAALEVIPYEAKDWCYRGRIYLELEQTDEAFSAFEESYNKGYAQAGYYLGYCYELQGKSEEAINLYQEQIKHDPQDAGLYQSAFIVPCSSGRISGCADYDSKRNAAGR